MRSALSRFELFWLSSERSEILATADDRAVEGPGLHASVMGMLRQLGVADVDTRQASCYQWRADQIEQSERCRTNLTSAHGFDNQAFFNAVDSRRREQQLSWPALARAIWEQSHVLNARRNDHPISPETIRKMGDRAGMSCQHALFLLRWLGVPPRPAGGTPPRYSALRGC